MSRLFLPALTNYAMMPRTFADWNKTKMLAVPEMIDQMPCYRTTETSATGPHYLLGASTTFTPGPFIGYVIAKAAGRDYLGLYCAESKGEWFNLATGALGGALVGAPSSTGIVDLGDGWYLCWIGHTAAGTTESINVYSSYDGLTAHLSYAGDVTKGHYLLMGGLVDASVLVPPFDGDTAACAWSGTVGSSNSTLTASGLTFDGIVGIDSDGPAALDGQTIYARTDGYECGPVVVASAAYTAGEQAALAASWGDPVAVYSIVHPGDYLIPLDDDSTGYLKGS